MSHEIIDESAHTNFTMVPNIIHLKGLGNAAFRLYFWYKGVAGATGSCWQSLDTISVGTGMSKPTIASGRQELEEVNLITVKRSRLKNGSIKITVRIVDIWDENRESSHIFAPEILSSEPPNRDKENFNGRIKKSNSAELKNLDVIRYKANKKRAKALSENTKLPNSRKGKTSSPFDHKAAAQLRKVVSSHIKINRNASMEKWANSFRLLREHDGVSADEIKKAIKWYKHHIGEEFIPEAFSAETFREKYNNGKILAAMQRTDESGQGNRNGNGKVDALDVFNNLQILGTVLDPDQEDIDDAAAMLGVSAGTFTVKDVMH